MRLTLTPTAEFARIHGALCRVWTGVDEAGTEVRAWIKMIQPQTHDVARLASFDAGLRELPRPRTAVIADMCFFTGDDDV